MIIGSELLGLTTLFLVRQSKADPISQGGHLLLVTGLSGLFFKRKLIKEIKQEFVDKFRSEETKNYWKEGCLISGISFLTIIVGNTYSIWKGSTRLLSNSR